MARTSRSRSFTAKAAGAAAAAAALVGVPWAVRRMRGREHVTKAGRCIPICKKG
ncbi:hypothetical protein [Streptomyces sp. WAC05374]|uniref:hypothetical protein n=1 Tax=Streptomyces sp. WAC05374 TaxID=2487420 RepID=UPI00135BD2B6|nr:hypothetical protein [Streptomyces sp. WAC05374]